MASKKVNIMDVCSEIFAGGDAPKNRMAIEKTSEYTIPIYSNGEDRDGLYGYTNFARVSLPSITVSARGTIGYASIRKEPFVPIVRLITITPISELIDIHYLYYAIKNFNFSGSGTSIPQLTVPMIKQYNFPLPPLDEQRKIAAVLDNVSDLIAKRRTQLDKLDELVKSRFIEMFGMPGTDAFGWGMDRLGNACYINPKKGQDTRLVKGLDVSFVPMPAVTEHGEIDASARKKYEEVKTGFTYFAEHDVLFAKITPCMENGKGAIARNLCNGIGFGSTEFHVLRPIQEKTNPHWIYTLTSFSQFREDAANNMTGSAGQRRVPVSFLENYLVSVPPLDLQNRFTTFVAQTDKSKYFGMNGIKLLWKLNDIFLGAICE